MYAKKYESWLIFFASLALFLYGLFNRELLGHEVIHKIFAEEMLRFGPNIFPTLYGTPTTEQFGTLSFFIYLLALPGKTITTLTALLPCALASALSLVLLYQLAAPVDREWARISVLLALFTYQFFDCARSVSIAPFMMLSSLVCFYQCSQTVQKKYLALPLLLGFFMQGPLGLITAATGAWAFYISRADWRSLKKFSYYALFLLLVYSALLALIASYRFGAHFTQHLFYSQVFKPFAIANRLDSTLPLFIAYTVSSPLALISIFLLYRKNSVIKNNPLHGLCIWLCLNFILLSMTSTEHQLYMLLPIAPALALLAGNLWIHPAPLARISVRIFQLLCLALPFIALCLTLATIATMQLKSLSVHAHYFSAFCTLSLFALLSIFIFCNHPMHYIKTHAKTVIGIGLASFLSTMIFVVKPIEVSLQQSKSFTVPVMMALNPNETIGFLQMKPAEEPLLFFAALPNATVMPPIIFLSTLDEQTTTPMLYITPMKYFDALPENEKQKLTIVQTGQLGYHTVIAFRRSDFRDTP